MSEAPSVANVMAQVAVSGSVDDGTAKASEEKVISDLVALGATREAVLYMVNKAIALGVLERLTGQQLAVRAG